MLEKEYTTQGDLGMFYKTKAGRLEGIEQDGQSSCIDWCCSRVGTSRFPPLTLSIKVTNFDPKAKPKLACNLLAFTRHRAVVCPAPSGFVSLIPIISRARRYTGAWRTTLLFAWKISYNITVGPTVVELMFGPFWGKSSTYLLYCRC